MLKVVEVCAEGGEGCAEGGEGCSEGGWRLLAFVPQGCCLGKSLVSGVNS